MKKKAPTCSNSKGPKIKAAIEMQNTVITLINNQRTMEQIVCSGS